MRRICAVDPPGVERIVLLHGAGNQFHEKPAAQVVDIGPPHGTDGVVERRGGRTGVREEIGRTEHRVAQPTADQRVELARAATERRRETVLHLHLHHDRPVVGVGVVPRAQVVEAPAQELVARARPQLVGRGRARTVVVVRDRVRMRHPPIRTGRIGPHVELDQPRAGVESIRQERVAVLLERVVHPDRRHVGQAWCGRTGIRSRGCRYERGQGGERDRHDHGRSGHSEHTTHGEGDRGHVSRRRSGHPSWGISASSATTVAAATSPA